MKVLVACEESQVVCKAFRAKGHIAYSCDIQPCSGGHPEWHILGDVLNVLNPISYYPYLYDSIHFHTMDGVYHEIIGRWDLIIAHPPCTYMSKAGARWMYPKAGEISPVRLKAALSAKDFFMKFINADCDRLCVENPVPLKIVELPPFTQKIQPFEFGHPYSKATCLWLKGLPKLKPTNILHEYVTFLPSNCSGFSKGKGGNYGVAHDAKFRSRTFENIAVAMADQWG